MSVKDSIPESANWWDDPDFQNKLVALLIQDQQTLTSCGSLLSPDDFKPSKGVPDGQARWLVAERALEFFEKHHAPIGSLIRSDVLEYATNLNLGAMQVGNLKTYLKLLQGVKPSAPDFLVDKVIRFKSNIIKKDALNEMTELLMSNQLPDEKWEEISRRVQEVNSRNKLKTVNYLQTLEDRMTRRVNGLKKLQTPLTLIDPLDLLLKRTVGPKQVGLILAPYKRGKSTMLLWLAVALSLQKYNVLYVTLEDTQDLVEDRLDSIVTSFMGKSISIDNLVNMPKTLRMRFQRFKGLVHSQIHLFDGVGLSEPVTISMLDKVIQDCRNEGFIPHAVVVDYDEKIKPARRHKEKRFEMDEVYNDFITLCGRYNMIGWIAAQTKRGTRGMKILSGDQVAEDIGKARKVTCCISLGKGDSGWGDNSIFLWVAAHKTDKMEIGTHIVTDLDRALIYDREATERAARLNATTP